MAVAPLDEPPTPAFHRLRTFSDRVRSVVPDADWISAGMTADFAEAIFAASSARGGASAQVRRITTAEYPTPARRPANSRLDCTAIANAHGVALPGWRTALETVIARLQTPQA